MTSKTRLQLHKNRRGSHVKAGSNSNQNRQNFSLKHNLIELNRDLEKVLFSIDDKTYDHYFYKHSHDIKLQSLSFLQQAILYLEDRRFLVHRGFELRAPLRLLKRAILRRRAGAVSTVDQQLVRICTGRYERTLRRKVRETVLAFLVNSHRSKAEIFYAYLHDSYFGYRLEGCEVTSRFLFSKSATELSLEEASFVASLLARPLPKKVFEAVVKEKEFRTITPEHLIRLGELENLDWASHVRSRYQYVRLMFPSIPSSLRSR
jgi:membrane peptidoglycan carboxypeptidase